MPRPSRTRGKTSWPVLEDYYRKYNRPEYISTDPVEFVHQYASLEDREIVGFIASCLAYGRVAQIRAISRVLEITGPDPSYFLKTSRPKDFQVLFSGFCHRFCKDENMASLMTAMQALLKKYGGLEQAFADGFDSSGKTVLSGLTPFYEKIRRAAQDGVSHLVADPSKKSACKRLNLFLRWMVRNDEVDPGGWTCVSPAQLLVPLDVHMQRICRSFAFTSSKQANMKSALEVTKAFGAIIPEDPVRYDFALTRASMEAPGLFMERD